MNLLNETRSALRENHKTWLDVRHIVCDAGEIPIPDFRRIAFADYDAGYGSVEVNPSLKIVGDDWWLERAEYDGKEWWEYKTLPSVPTKVAGRVFTKRWSGNDRKENAVESDKGR